MPRFTHVGGLSFSGAREPLSNLWSALGVERGGRLHILDLRPHAYRLDAAAFLLGGWRGCCCERGDARTVWAIDTPLALPRPVAAAVTGDDAPDWFQTVRRIASLPPDAVRDAAESKPPLDPRSYRRTAEGFRFVDELLREGVAVSPQATRTDAAATLIEVLPTQTAKDLNLTGRRPRKVGDAHARTRKLAAYAAFDHPSLEATAATLDAAWDAVLACITAFSVRDHLDQPPHSQAATEGWVYRHPEAVGSRDLAADERG